MKIVINSCYGGFNLSPLAVKRLAELNGKECYFFRFDHGNLDTHVPTTAKEIGTSLFWSAFSVPNPDSHLPKTDRWCVMTPEEKDRVNAAHTQIALSLRPEDRADPKLVQVVEELGSEKASGSCAELKVVKIPDGTDYVIEDYDGVESIHEKHQSWD